MDKKTLRIAHIATLIIALLGLCVMIYGWFVTQKDIPVVLSGVISALIFAVLGFNKVPAAPSPDRKDDDAKVDKEEIK